MGRFRWGVVSAGQGLAVGGYLFVFWVMKMNTFASSTIQVQAGQTLIHTGPYAIVRHPMYLSRIATFQEVRAVVAQLAALSGTSNASR